MDLILKRNETDDALIEVITTYGKTPIVIGTIYIDSFSNEIRDRIKEEESIECELTFKKTTRDEIVYKEYL